MKRFRQLSMAVVLTLMLGAPALAGIIGCPPEPEPPSATATGITDTPPSAQPGAPATDPVMDVVLDLMQSVLSLL